MVDEVDEDEAGVVDEVDKVDEDKADEAGVVDEESC